MISQIDILEDLKESSDEYQHVILGTYSFDPDFFELKILPVLRSKDAETILVLTDKNEYHNRFSDMSRAGQEYYIDYCYASQVFHPKFILLTWSEGIKLILGSANLTKKAWFESGEMIGSLTYHYSDPNKQVEKILGEFRDFLSKIIEKNMLKSQKHKLKILDIIKKLPESKKQIDSEIKLIHNIDRPILEQVKQFINKPIKSVKISAPFFNSEGSVLDFFVKAGCKNFELYIQPNTVTEFPKDKIKKLESKGISIITNQIKFKDNESRFIHAKILIIKTDSGSFCIYGSANPTFSGMLSTPEKGNLELCVLSRNTDPKYYDKLIHNDSIVIEKIRIDDVSENKTEKADTGKTSQENLIDSYLEDKSLILIRESNVKSFDVVLAHFSEEVLKIPIKSDKQELTIHLNDEQFIFCSKPTYVFIEYLHNGQTIQSNKRWISTQTLELTPRRMDIERIQKSYGRLGLISFLNKLEKFADDSEWFYYLLQRVRFEKLASLEPIRRRIMQRKFDTEEDTEYEIPPKIDVSTSFKNKFQKNNKTIKESLEDMNDIEEFDKLFNQFLAWSKVEIWFVLRNSEFIDNLRFIRANMEEFLKQTQRLRRKNEFLDHLDKIHFWHHLLFFSYLIFRFHKKAGFMQNNKGVVKVFSTTTSGVIQSFQNKHKPIELSEMEQAIKEYEEFDDLKIDLLEMEQIFREEFGANILKIT